MSGDEVFETGSAVEAVEAVEAIEHHRHHPADPNVGVVRGQVSRHAVLAAALTAAVTLVGVVLLALAIGNK